MNPTIDLDSLRVSGLWPHQAEFIIEFLQPDSPSFQLLVAPWGSGKTFMADNLIGYFVDVTKAGRVLVIATSKVQVGQYVSRLYEKVINIPIITLDRKRLRLLEADTLANESPFSEPLITVVIHEETRDIRLADALGSIIWDLVVVDEASSFFTDRKEAAFIELLLEDEKAKRMLLLSNRYLEDYVPRSKLSSIHVITWSTDLIDWEGKPLFVFSQPQIRMISYERGPEEVAFLDELRELELGYVDDRMAHTKKAALLRLASSSLYAIEQSLLRQSYRMLRPSEQSAFGESTETIEVVEQFENEIESSIDKASKPVSQVDESTRVQLANLIELLEQVQEDSKLQALIKEISSTRNENPTVNYIILSSYAATVNYLASALDELDINIVQMTGSMSQKAVKSARNEFVHRGGILVAITIVLEGLDLGKGGFDVLVYYDLPSSNHTIALRTKIALTQDSRKTIRLYTFEDTSGALPYEATRLKKFMTVFDSSLESNEEADSTQRGLFDNTNDDMEH